MDAREIGWEMAELQYLPRLPEGQELELVPRTLSGVAALGGHSSLAENLRGQRALQHGQAGGGIRDDCAERVH
jgi:hypothetical protein